MITQLYLDGMLGTGAMLSGLLVSAGVGILVLFGENRRIRQNVITQGTVCHRRCVGPLVPGAKYHLYVAATPPL